MDEPVYRMLGLCMKAGRLLSGNEQVAEGLKNVKAPKGALLIITEDSSQEQRMSIEMLQKERISPTDCLEKRKGWAAPSAKGCAQRRSSQTKASAARLLKRSTRRWLKDSCQGQMEMGLRAARRQRAAAE